MRQYSPIGSLWNYPAEKIMWDGLREKWPQLNERTKISLTDRREIYLAEPLDMTNYFKDMVRILISGWQRLKQNLFHTQVSFKNGKFLSESETMDDPVERAKYVKRFWKSLLYAPIPYFWRITGRLFRRQDLYNKGTELAPNPTMPTPRGRMLILQHFGCELYGERYYGAFAYDAPSDTLFVRKLQ